jgi:hypothetical protein
MKNFPVDSIQDLYMNGNFYDALHKLYPSKTIVSASSSLTGALVLSPHLKNVGKHIQSQYWEKKTNSYVSVSGKSSYSINIQDYPVLMKKLAGVMGITVLYDEIDQTVKMGDLEFDLSSTAADSLFAEVLFLVYMGHHPVDFLSFHFESLTQIATLYGTTSEEYEMAVRMIDAVIAHIQSTYETHQSLQMTIIYLNENANTQEVISTIEPILENRLELPLGKDLLTTLSDTLPNIFLSQSGRDKVNEICQDLRSVLVSFDLAVDCPMAPTKRSLSQTPPPAPEPSPEPSPLPAPSPSSEPSPVPAPSSPIPPVPVPAPAPDPSIATQQEVELVHIVLWLVIALICALVQACYRLSVLDGSNEPEFKPKTYEGAGVRGKTTKM